MPFSNLLGTQMLSEAIDSAGASLGGVSSDRFVLGFDHSGLDFFWAVQHGGMNKLVEQEWRVSWSIEWKENMQ
jgi:hypothetical protein